MIIIDFLRHGEPHGGARFRGHGCDDPLSEQGWRQMWQTLGESLHWPWEAVLTSPLVRCRAFAEAVCARKPTPLRVVDDLREVGFGEWEGCSLDEIRTGRTAEYRAFYADPAGNRPAGAEPLADFRRRVERALVAEIEATDAERLLVVTHAGVIRSVVGWVLGVPDERIYRLDCDYASISQIRHDPERGWRVGFTNRRE